MTNQTKANNKSINNHHYDIILIGGGMVGVSAAIALSQLSSAANQFKIAVVEAFEPSMDTSPSFDQRAVALSAASVDILKTLELWPQIKPLACPIEHIHVSNRGHFGYARLTAKDYQVEALGQVIPLDQTGPILWQAMQQQTNIDCYCPYQLDQIIAQQHELSDKDLSDADCKDYQSLIIQDTEGKKVQLSGKLVLAADGTLSAVAKQLSMPMKIKPYAQRAVIANISTQQAHNNRAFERFTDQGPIALLPLTRNRMSLVWCVADDQWQSLMQCDEKSFLQQLQQAFGFRLGYFTKVGQRASYPLALRVAEKAHYQRVMLLGNAAHTLHPIAGQGFNLALRDVAALVDFIALALQQDKDFASSQSLKSFEQQRQVDWQKTICVTDSLVSLFSNNFWPLVFARNKLLCLLDHLPAAKNILARHAMGYGGTAANLTRGIATK
ncbi:MAG: 2-octaprenyl-6-methoxyphenyl hydroxylase [Enterobacterales bacterium]|nr:2-octaprenyl-6-methoxyphenyl hydroxylase [Enterobacterales bacterium]